MAKTNEVSLISTELKGQGLTFSRVLLNLRLAHRTLVGCGLLLHFASKIET